MDGKSVNQGLDAKLLDCFRGESNARLQIPVGFGISRGELCSLRILLPRPSDVMKTVRLLCRLLTLGFPSQLDNRPCGQC